MFTKQDITQYSDDELSLIVFNDEGLYRFRNSASLEDTLRDFFIFTDEQLQVLKDDLENEEE